MCIFVDNSLTINEMDLQQSVQGNSSCRSTSSTTGILAPSISNLTITTTNATPTIATVENNGNSTVSPSSSPNADVNRHHNNNHHHRTQSVVTQKSNQVCFSHVSNLSFIFLVFF